MSYNLYKRKMIKRPRRGNGRIRSFLAGTMVAGIMLVPLLTNSKEAISPMEYCSEQMETLTIQDVPEHIRAKIIERELLVRIVGDGYEPSLKPPPKKPIRLSEEMLSN